MSASVVVHYNKVSLLCLYWIKVLSVTITNNQLILANNANDNRGCIPLAFFDSHKWNVT